MTHPLGRDARRPMVRQVSVEGPPAELHELRVRVPLELHRQLLSLKILRGQSLAETVSRALDLYFAERAQMAREAKDAAA